MLRSTRLVLDAAVDITHGLGDGEIYRKKRFRENVKEENLSCPDDDHLSTYGISLTHFYFCKCLVKIGQPLIHVNYISITIIKGPY